MEVRKNVASLPEYWHIDDAAEPLAGRLKEAYGLLASDPLTAARTAEELFPQVRTSHGLAPWLALVVSVSGRIRTLSDFHPLDPFIEFYDRNRARLTGPGELLEEIDCAVFGALLFRRPDHPDLPRLAERCLAIFQEENSEKPLVRLSAANYLMLHRIWCGDLLGADALSARMAALHAQTGDVHARLMCHSMISMIQRLYLRYDACQEQIESGLALARETGVHIWDSQFHMQGAMLALSRENTEEARAWLEPMAELAPPEHYMDRAGYHYCLAWLHAVEQDIPLAIRHAEEAVVQAERSGAIFPQTVTHVGLGQINLEQRRIRAGFYHFIQARRTGRRMSSDQPLRFMRGLLVAHLAYSSGLRRRGERALRQALAIGRRQHFLNFPWWRSDIVARLCAWALESGIEPDYVRNLIRARRLRAPTDVRVPENWLWPLQIQVLGAQRILLNGEDVHLSPQLLSLVMALACMADREGWVSRERLVDELWPDSEGDHGQRALDTSIHRLRRQLGQESLIRVRPGRVGLDAGFCRVDYWQLREQLNCDAPSVADVEEMMATLERLQHDISHAWLPPTQTLQHRIACVIVHAAQGPLLEHHRVPQWLESLLAYLPTSEQIWQAMIQYHLHQGQYGDALDAWQRCREVLISDQGVEPSPATRALLREIPERRKIKH